MITTNRLPERQLAALQSELQRWKTAFSQLQYECGKAQEEAGHRAARKRKKGAA